MTENGLRGHYEALVNSQVSPISRRDSLSISDDINQKTLESCLHKNLAEHINSELALRSMCRLSFVRRYSTDASSTAISSVSTTIEWLRSTFLYVRIVKNPTFYALNNGSTPPETRLEEICANSVRELVETGVVEEDGERLNSTGESCVPSRSPKDLPLMLDL